MTQRSMVYASSGGSEGSKKRKMESIDYPHFSFELTGKSSKSKARTGLITTPHGTVETPNFIFCATKAALKAVTTEQLRAEGAQIMLSNTYHLMLQPGAETVAKLGGLQKMTGWNGPMFTDSGGYQIFSMGHGSVSEEIKGKRNAEGMGWSKTLLKIDEEGATFRSYVDGNVHVLTPEKCIDIQRQLGADLIVVLDECTPFNIDRNYTKESMDRSHRWAVRCLEHFRRTDTLRQALYGIVQGGIYSDLRQESADFVNDHPFFGMAIGGTLGATKREMHEIVAYTRGMLRDDRPVHLLGIGGIRDIFHGVRQGIDTFDCVHPTRLGRHGSALVRADFWSEGPYEGVSDLSQITQDTPAEQIVELLPPSLRNKLRTKQARSSDRLRTYTDELAKLKIAGAARSVLTEDREQERREKLLKVKAKIAEVNEHIRLLPFSMLEEHRRTILARQTRPTRSSSASSRAGEGKDKSPPPSSYHGRVREHVPMRRSHLEHDPRPIDPTCSCYTCRNFSRGYLHHLFKAEEMVGSTLVTIHNVAFMTRLMRDIRRGIAEDRLDEVEREYVHPDIAESVGDSLTIGE